jgi:phytoene dehydrogenase-like protein
MTNIRFIYLYRDASNYKQHGEVILSNETQLTVEEIDTQIRSLLSDGLFFIAGQMQLEERFFAVVNEDDHPWHEYVQVEATTDPTFDPVPEAKRDITQFLQELEQAHHTGWDDTQVREDLVRQIEKEREVLKRWLDDWGRC